MNVCITHRDVDVYIIYLLSISPVSLSSRRSVLSSDEASTQLPSREKLTHVTGSGRLRLKQNRIYITEAQFVKFGIYKLAIVSQCSFPNRKS